MKRKLEAFLISVFLLFTILPASANTKLPQPDFKLEDITYTVGKPYTEVHKNKPWFSASDAGTKAYETYSSLDKLGRCQTVWANIGTELMPTKKRESISSIKPSGWQSVEYESVDGGSLYNRCHFIGYQLTAENANIHNLITGTRYLNKEGMLPFENMVADYVKETGNHVLYRVTPIYVDSELVARGVLMEAVSVEDKGDGIEFCVFCWNVQPGIEIDYATGASKAVKETDTAVGKKEEPAPEKKQETEPETHVVQETTVSYILNSNTGKFHLPYCRSVKQMKEKNKVYFEGTRAEAINRGYDPCKNCNP